MLGHCTRLKMKEATFWTTKNRSTRRQHKKPFNDKSFSAGFKKQDFRKDIQEDFSGGLSGGLMRISSNRRI